MIKNRFLLQDKFNSCHRSQETALPMNTEKENTTAENKIVVYQVFTRLFGNKNTDPGDN
jgi:hypothetical protein